MHLKRQKVPKNWPIPRKGTTFVVRAKHDLKKGIPVLILLRDVLRLTRTKKETKRAIHSKLVLLNNKKISDEKNAVLLFDVLTIVPEKKNYKLTLSEKGKFKVEEVKEVGQKIAKIVNKKILKGKKIQLNLSDGRNFLSDTKCKTNDSVVVDLEQKKILKCLALKEKAKVMVVGGKHAGKKGVVVKIDLKRKLIKIEAGKEKINALIKHLVVIE